MDLADIEEQGDMSHDESGDSRPAKRQKVESRGLFKPPTNEELHMLANNSVQQTSTLFKLQVSLQTYRQNFLVLLFVQRGILVNSFK